MQFEGSELRNVLRGQQKQAVEVFDRGGMMRGTLTPTEALKLVSGPIEFFGCGSPRRIRFVRPATGCVGIGSEASVTVLGNRKELKRHHGEHCGLWRLRL